MESKMRQHNNFNFLGSQKEQPKGLKSSKNSPRSNCKNKLVAQLSKGDLNENNLETTAAASEDLPYHSESPAQPFAEKNINNNMSN